MQEVLRFDRFVVRPRQRQLLVGDQPVAVGARAFDVLLTLIGCSGELVSRHELFDAVWPGRVVEENNLVVQVGTLRKLLGADVIATIPGRGYRFTAQPVDAAGRHVAVATDAASGPTASGDDSAPTIGVALPPLIGREDDLLALGAELASQRFVTVIGLGGTGKTRVALQLVQDQRVTLAQRVAWVDLAGLSDPALVAGAVASALGLQLGPGDPLSSVVAWLQPKRMLLVIDNAEHLLDAVAGVVCAIMQGAPEVRLLVTSQVPLREAGERVYRLGALALPDGNVSCEQALSYGAVALFVDRARAVDRGFSLNPGNLGAVVTVCRQLDGLAMAIELAAARVPLLGVAGLAQALDARLHWLTGGKRSAPRRQQTLRAALEWTCSLFSDAERRVFRRLGVFAGGFTLEMAQCVAADDASSAGSAPVLDRWDVTEALGDLVDRSLVEADTAALPRYRLLESPRAYACELLGDAGETRWARDRHARYLCRLYDRACDDWLRLSDVAWRIAYPAEADNIRAAIDWALGPDGDSAIGVALTGASATMWMIQGLYGEGLMRLQAAAAHIDVQTPSAIRARVWTWLGQLRINGMPNDAMVAFGKAVECHREDSNALGLAFALIGLGRAAAATDRTDIAVRSLADAHAQLLIESTDKVRGRHADVLGFLHEQRGDHRGAVTLYRRAMALYRSAGNEQSMLNMLVKFAGASWSAGDLDAAVTGFRQAAATLRQSPWATKGMLGVCLTNLAGVHTQRMELAEALVAAREGLPLREEAGYAWGALDHLALRAALAGRPADAARLAGCADATFAEKGAARQPNEARSRTLLQALLTERLGVAEAGRLLDEGGRLGVAQACRLALAD